MDKRRKRLKRTLKCRIDRKRTLRNSLLNFLLQKRFVPSYVKAQSFILNIKVSLSSNPLSLLGSHISYVQQYLIPPNRDQCPLAPATEQSC